MRTRSAREEDLSALMALEEKGFGPRGWEEGFVRKLMEDPNVSTLVVEDQGLIAYTMFTISSVYETAEVLSLAVAPARRRQGIGSALVAQVEHLSAEGGARTMMLCVRPDNQEAVNLYLSRGYKVLARCNGYYEDGSDADMMVKHLEE